MRTLIRRTLGKRRTERATGGTRIVLPAVLPEYTGYPACPGLDINELDAHFHLRRVLGEPV